MYQPNPFIAFLSICASCSALKGLAGTMVGLDLSTMLACTFKFAIPVVAMPTLGPPGACKIYGAIIRHLNYIDSIKFYIFLGNNKGAIDIN